MAVLSEGEMLLKEQVELQKGISHTNDEFKTMLASSKQYQQMLRAINRQLVEHNTTYGKIKEKNEEIFDVIFNYSKIITDQKLSSEFNNIYKNINKISDEFKDLNSKLQTGDISLKEYQKSFDKLGQVQKSIERQKILLDMKKNSIQEEFEAETELLKKKERIVKRYGDKTKDDLIKDLNKEISLRNSHQTRLNNLQKTISNTSYIKRDVRKRLQDEIDMEISFITNKENSINKIKRQVKKAPTRSELTKLQDSVVDKTGDLRNIETVNTALDKTKGLTQETAEEFVKSRKEIEAIDKKIGNIGRTMGVLQHFGMNQIFDFKAIEDAMQSAAREEYLLEQQRLNGYDVTIKKFGVARAGISAMGSELTSKFGVVGAVGGGMWLGKQILDLFFQADERTKAISKNQAITRNDAEGILSTYSKLSVANERISVFGQSIATTAATQKELLETSLSISNGLGLNYNIANKAEGDLLVNIKERMGLSEESRQTFLENSRLSGESLNDYLNSILGVNVVNKANNKFYMNDKALLNDVSKLSSIIRLQFKGHSSDLSQIVINSKKYGFEISKIDSSMNSMMDWEKQAELQTSFFSQTGKYIDTSRLQFFSMYNMVENYQEELNKLIGEENDFTKLPRLARQTKAELLGVNEQELADIFLKREINKKFSKEELATEEQLGIMTRKKQKETIDGLIAQGYSMQFITKYMGEIDTKLMSDITSAENFQRALEKIKDTFATFVNKGGVEKLIDGVTGMTQNIHSFLEKWGDTLGIKTEVGVLSKYDTDGMFDLGAFGLKEKLSESFKGTSVEQEGREDLEYISKLYQKKYGISENYTNNFMMNMEKILQRQTRDTNMPLQQMMDIYSQTYVKQNPKVVNKKNETINDGIISPNGKVVVQTPLGQINTNPKDYLIATPSPNELLQKNVQQVSQFMIDDTKIVTTLQMVTKAVEKSAQDIVKAVSANKDVYMNQRKVGEVFNINNQRV